MRKTSSENRSQWKRFDTVWIYSIENPNRTFHSWSMVVLSTMNNSAGVVPSVFRTSTMILVDEWLCDMNHSQWTNESTRSGRGSSRWSPWKSIWEIFVTNQRTKPIDIVPNRNMRTHLSSLDQSQHRIQPDSKWIPVRSIMSMNRSNDEWRENVHLYRLQRFLEGCSNKSRGVDRETIEKNERQW